MLTEYVALIFLRAYWTDAPVKAVSYWSRVQRSYIMKFDWEMMTYWAIVVFAHALAYYREAQERRSAHHGSRRGWSRRSSRRCSASCSRTFSSTRSTRSRR